MAKPYTESIDDDGDVAGFIPPEANLDGQGLTLLDRFFRVLDDERFREMKPGEQLLYLQLLRRQHGKQHEMIEASRSQMSTWTGLAWDTVKKYLPSLMERGLVTQVRPAGHTYSAAYEVHWLPPLPAPIESTHPNTAATYVDQMDAADLAEYQRLEHLLPIAERRQLHNDVSQELHQMGIDWNYDLIKKVVIWRFLTRSPYKRKLVDKYPKWFAPPKTF